MFFIYFERIYIFPIIFKISFLKVTG